MRPAGSSATCVSSSFQTPAFLRRPVFVGGAPEKASTFWARVDGIFPWIILIVLVLSYVVMLRAFRSLLLPLMAIFLDAISIAATYGLLVVIFRFGAGADVLGLYRVSQIEGWVPVFLFAVLFGLSMDYEFFLVRRMREAWTADSTPVAPSPKDSRGRDASSAPRRSSWSARFLGLVAGRIVDLQEIGVGLALGVLIDATVVRGLLLPGLMTLLGPWSWWLPQPIAHLARIESSPIDDRQGESTRRLPT